MQQAMHEARAATETSVAGLVKMLLDERKADKERDEAKAAEKARAAAEALHTMYMYI